MVDGGLVRATCNEGDGDVMAHMMPQDDGQLSLHLSTKIDFYCFKWTFDCMPLSDEEQRIAFLRTSLVQPLLAITGEMQQQLRELTRIIALKGSLVLFFALLLSVVDLHNANLSRCGDCRVQGEGREAA